MRLDDVVEELAIVRHQQQCAGETLQPASSHNTASRSRWLVGSSSIRTSARDISARAMLARICSPPDKLLHRPLDVVGANPRPSASSAARAAEV